MLAVAIPVGLLIGLSLGALGAGGSILTVPALVYLLGESPLEATTASLVIVGVTAVAGTVSHLRAGRVRMREGMVFGVLGVAAAYAGSRLSAHADPNALLAGFSVLMMVAAGAMLRRVRQQTPSVPEPVDEPTPLRVPASTSAAAGPGTEVAPGPVPAGAATRGRARGGGVVLALRVLLAASVVGLLTGFFGVGGGFVIVPALTLVLGFPMPVAVGTSLLVIAMNSSVALVTRLGNGVDLDWRVVATFTVAAIAGSVLGSRVASRVDPRRLTLAFVVLLVAVAVYTAARSLPQLL